LGSPPEEQESGVRPILIRADDETRTRDPHLGKVMRYQLRHIRIARISACRETLTDSRIDSKPSGPCDTFDQIMHGIAAGTPGVSSGGRHPCLPTPPADVHSPSMVG
jgi:hypothetical protein